MGQAQSANAPRRQPVGAGFQFPFMLSCCGVSCIGTEDQTKAADGTSSGTPVKNINIIPEVFPQRRWSRPQSHPSYCPRRPLTNHGSSLWSLADRSGSLECPLEWQLLPGVPSSTWTGPHRDPGFFDSETSSASNDSGWARDIDEFMRGTSCVTS
ncbi:hypothetical protein DPEC_G00307210 [Dallia pectoralis]|uniref:Uncharacterized protein n=1 Tax=Dallia pectoralis TaxID=75939 RepID=A0ACC2FEA9_DALPE|nr:hypothetical protein DPEC_G00380660 [Dallia pectoralis]KAJ7989696.1 hypothetical protein DPEC_G00307210 [Dallia pectoralis]